MLEAKLLAEKAVKDGDDTLKKANSTYHLLQSFNNEVDRSSQSAKIALQEVNAINEQIKDISNIIRDTEQVKHFTFYLNFKIIVKLTGTQ